MRILITGGAGFIGANLVAELVREFEVGVIDDLSTGSADNLHADAWFQKMGILEPDFQRVLGEFDPDVVVHLAAQSSVAVSLEDPERDWAVNVEGTRRVAEAAVACGASRMVSASSAAVYGEPAEEDLPLSETAQKLPTSPYGESKLAAEEVLAGVLVSTDVDFASFRFANVYGPGQDPTGEAGVVAIFIETSQHRPQLVFGSAILSQALNHSGRGRLRLDRVRSPDEPHELGRCAKRNGHRLSSISLGLEQHCILVQEQRAPNRQHGDEHDHGAHTPDRGTRRRRPEARLSTPERQPEQERPAREPEQYRLGVGQQADQQQIDEDRRSAPPRMGEREAQ